MKLVLMNKNTPVFEFVSEEYSFYALSILSAENPEYAPLSIEIDDGVVNRQKFNDWLINRRIPASRMQLESGLNRLSVSANEEITTSLLAEKCFYLSLSDQYWVKPVDINIKWDDINFFTNSFSNDVGEALFDGKSKNNPDLFSPCNSSDGVLKKKWIIANDKRILVKAGTGVYSQETFNEKIGSKVCELLGINNYVSYDIRLANNQPESVCECFVKGETEFVTANEILKHFLPNPRISQYKHYVKCCERLGFDTISALDEMFVVDYIIGNTDRHFRNFGLIRDVDSLKIIGAAPLFDFGNSLFNNVPEHLIDFEKDIDSKPFCDTHSEQIKLVTDIDRFDFSNLSNIKTEVYEILSEYSYIPQERAKLISQFVEHRVESLENIQSIDLTMDNGKNRR